MASHEGHRLMHIEAFTWIRDALYAAWPNKMTKIDIAEFGGLDVNGTLRGLYPRAHWLCVDIEDGPGVDIVADARTWQPDPRRTFDLVVCAEVFEHCDRYGEIVANARTLCGPESLFVCTAACEPRAPHGAYDPDGTHGFRDGEYYRNVVPAALLHHLREQFSWIDMTVDGRRGDVYAAARP